MQIAIANRNVRLCLQLPNYSAMSAAPGALQLRVRSDGGGTR